MFSVPEERMVKLNMKSKIIQRAALGCAALFIL